MMHVPVQSARLFTFERRYDQIDWTDFRAVVGAYREQIEYWYIWPALELSEEGHFGFPVVALTCLLADCLSQYEEGVLESDREVMKRFLRKHWPELGNRFSVRISAQFRGTTFDIVDGADAIYHGVRCGVLHEAHVKLYTALVSQSTIVDFHPTGLAEYADGTPCPVVTVCPAKFLEAVRSRFDRYLEELLDSDPQYDESRRRFKIKFQDCYGVRISTRL